MAYLSPEGQDQQQQPATPATGGAPGATPAPTQTGATAGGTKTASPNTASPVTPGTAATNVNEYLNANAPQTQQYANNVASGLTNQYGQIQSDIGSAANQFNNQINAGYTPENTALVNQAAANPASFASNPNNVSAFQAQENDQYTGPTQFETSSPYTGLTNEVTAGTNAATPWQSFSGTASQFGNLGDQTLGEQNLDATLFAQTPGVNQEIQNAATPFNSLNSYLTNVGTGADAAAAAAAANATAAAGNVQSVFNPLETNFNTNLANETTQAGTANLAYQQEQLQQQAADNAAIQSAFNAFETNNPISNAQGNAALFNNLGVTGTGPGIQLNAAAPTLAQTATPEQYAEANALSELMGNNYANPLAGQTTSTYNPFTSTPSILQQNSGMLDPVDAYLQQYLEAEGEGSSIPYAGSGTYVTGTTPADSTQWLTPTTPAPAALTTPYSPIEALNSPINALSVSEAYQKMLEEIAPELYATPGMNPSPNGGAATFGGTPPTAPIGANQ